MLLLLGFAFLAGVVTILSPCILPVLPVVLASSASGGRTRPWGVVLGFILSFTVFTLTLSALVRFFHISPDLLRWLAAGLIVVFGVVLVVPFLKEVFLRWATGLTSRLTPQSSAVPGKPRGGFWSGLVLGASLGLVWTPCVGPIMASVVSLALSQTVDAGSVFITLAYSAGTAVPLFLILQGGRTLLNKFPSFTRHSSGIQRFFGALMILTGIALFTGFDRTVQTWILQTFPQYGAGLTSLENQKIVRQELLKRQDQLEAARSEPLLPSNSAVDPLTLG
ncbi:MAG: cytochrome c biogenesis protein CcdA, partial [Spirochaetales bacterium]|nr:cytochrome c biogenesis protein CcdA [Spirochaetales bacterium]